MIPAFYYHSIGESPLSVSVADFRRHLDLIVRAGKRAVALSHLLTASDQDRPNLVGMSFDDCFYDVFENALPALVEYGFTATFFAVLGYDGATLWGNAVAGRWSDRPGEGFDIPFTFMGPAERAQTSALGMEIGCHTMSHPNLDSLSKDAQREEIVRSKEFLEHELGCTVRTFCFPRGRYDDNSLAVVREADFQSAWSTRLGYVGAAANKFELPRFGVTGDSAIFSSILDGRGSRLSVAQRGWRRLKRYVTDS